MLKLSSILVILTSLLGLPSSVTAPAEYIPVSHYRTADIQLGISAFPPRTPSDLNAVVRGGVVSHHLLAQHEIARFFQNLSAHSYKSVILLGPNHGELGDSHLISTKATWETPYGSVLPNTYVLSHLPPLVVIDSGIMRSDHALEVIMPFIKSYLPHATVTPLLVSARTTDTEINELTASLLPWIDSQTLLLVSSDFSHYLLPAEAARHDQKTLSLIKNWDLEQLGQLDNSSLDSGKSLVILLSLLQQIDATHLEVFGHTDASTLAGTPSSATTTYFFLNYYDSPQK